MQNLCKNCKYITKLKHNLKQGNGFEESFCVGARFLPKEDNRRNGKCLYIAILFLIKPLFYSREV